MYNFTQYTAVGKKFEDRITITKNRFIGLPTQFFIDNKIGTYKYATVFYDGEQKAMGLSFTNDETIKGKIKIIKNKQGYGGHIVATGFFKLNKIDAARYAGRYDYKKVSSREVGIDQDGELFIIELKEKGESQ